METSPPHKKTSSKFSPYATQQTLVNRAAKPVCPPLSKSKEQLIKDDEVARLLHFPLETGRLLGKDTTAWCEFHKTHRHDTESCFPLTG